MSKLLQQRILAEQIQSKIFTALKEEFSKPYWQERGVILKDVTVSDELHIQHHVTAKREDIEEVMKVANGIVRNISFD